jgi:hypothetical protein
MTMRERDRFSVKNIKKSSTDRLANWYEKLCAESESIHKDTYINRVLSRFRKRGKRVVYHY